MGSICDVRDSVPSLPTLERYELLERIGRGGVGEVFRARERVGDFVREVCIKRLFASVPPEQVGALREEARLLARLRHANIVSLLGVGEEASGSPFLVLELIRGENLRTLCKAREAAGVVPDGEGLVPDRIAVHVACGVLRGLAAVQRAVPGLVHRDVTPHNVLVSNEGEVKLGDFGIALAVDRARSTPPHMVKGKLGYVSPEQLRNERLDVRNDVFAVGVMLYELLARRRPWRGEAGYRELRAIESAQRDPLHLHRPRIDPHLAAVIERLLAHRRHERFISADDALRALAPFSAGDLGSLRLAALVAEHARRCSEAP